MSRFEKATPAWTIPWDDAAVTAVAFLGSARKLAAGNELGQITLFDLAEKPDGPAPLPVRRLEGHTNAVTSLAALPGTGALVSASYDHTIRWWDLQAPAEGTMTIVLDRKAREAAAKKAGKGGGEVPGVCVELQKKARALEAHQEWVRSISIGSEGRQLLSGDDQGLAILWDAASAGEVRRFQSPGWLRAVALSADGRLAATCEFTPRYGGFANAIKLWDAATGTLKLDLGKELKKGDRVTGMAAAAFSPDGKLLALGQGGEVEGGKGKVTLVDPETGKKTQELAGHEYGITSLVFSPDGTLLASGGRDTQVRLWSIPDGKLLQELGKPRGGQFKDWIHATAFSPDGSRLAAADMAGQIHLWSLV
ncbi:MAG: WD40 repeat domain-containing protein [Planctomycetes bacterium]|nr:WD40 repeat domain-containing protein [Planctomycetota bacterium]